VRLNYIKEISKFSDYEDFDMMNLGSPYGNNFGTQSDSNVNIIQKSSRINDDDVPF
jgi:hypothetical protein